MTDNPAGAMGDIALDLHGIHQLIAALHPETRHGATGGTNAGKGRSEVANLASSVDRFTADTAKRTAHSERAVQRDVTRG